MAPARRRVACASPHDCTLPITKRVGKWNPLCHCLFSALEDSLLVAAMQFLPLTDIARMCFVSTRWHHVVLSSPLLWSTVRAEGDAQASALAVLSGSALGRLVRVVDLPKLRGPALPPTAPLLSSCTTLALRQAAVPAPFLAAVLAAASSATSVTLDASADVDGACLAALTRAAGSTLQVLSLKGCRLLTDDALQHVALPALRSLDLSGCKLLTPRCVAAVVARSPALERLVLRGVPVSDECVAAMARACPGQIGRAHV